MKSAMTERKFRERFVQDGFRLNGQVVDLAVEVAREAGLEFAEERTVLPERLVLNAGLSPGRLSVEDPRRGLRALNDKEEQECARRYDAYPELRVVLLRVRARIGNALGYLSQGGDKAQLRGGDSGNPWNLGAAIEEIETALAKGPQSGVPTP